MGVWKEDGKEKTKKRVEKAAKDDQTTKAVFVSKGGRNYVGQQKSGDIVDGLYVKE
jgi:hypothetical protein